MRVDTETKVRSADVGPPADRAGGASRVASTPEPAADPAPWVHGDFDAAVRVPRRGRAGWERRYLRQVIVLDMVIAVMAGIIGFAARFDDPSRQTQLRYLGFTALLPILWLVVLASNRAYERRYLYVGSEETRRVLRSGLMLITGISFTAYALQQNFSRGYMLGTLPIAIVGSVAARYLLRKRLHRRRAAGSCMESTVVVGHPRPASEMTRRLSRQRHHGLEVVAACLPPGVAEVYELEHTGVPVVGRAADVVEAVASHRAKVVIVLSCPEMDGNELRRLSWRLEATGAELLVAPALVDVTGPRTSVRLADGLPLLHVDPPEFSGFRRLAKSGLDRSSAALGLILITPVLLIIALAIWLEDRGPTIFRQTRVGRHGKEFVVLKFRSMNVDAEQQVATLLQHNEQDGLLFKIRRDPRVTRVGALLRRFSLDELPQLVNVLRGEMSLVGPRPPLPQEVSRYDHDLRRRLAVTPGLTGLWQVSGRADLSWAESVQLDMHYVENWSPALDLMILAKTLRAVLRGRGAY